MPDDSKSPLELISMGPYAGFDPDKDPFLRSHARRSPPPAGQGGLDAVFNSPVANAFKSKVADLIGQFGDIQPYTLLKDGKPLPTTREVADKVGANLDTPSGALGMIGLPDIWDAPRMAGMAATLLAAPTRRVLSHFSKKNNLTELDPSFYGTGIRGAEARRKEAYPEFWVDRTYFGIDVDKPGGYRPEPGLGTVRYDVTVDGKKLYDWEGDPLNLFKQLGEDIPPGARTSAVEKQIKELGFEGYHVGNTAALFDKTPIVGRRTASDLQRVDFPEDVPRPKELTRKSVGKGGRIPGAPAHVKTRNDEMRILEDYLAEAEEGMVGRKWYSSTAARIDRDVGNLSGQRPGAADQAAAVIGEFSPRASLEANRLAQVRATNQFATGRPVAAGMGPRNKAAQSILEEGKFSAGEAFKVGPFSMQVRGMEAPRGVHDVRDISAWGFPRDLSPGEANHRWMDKMTDEAVQLANERKLGGFDDWTHEQLQAARWVKDKADDMGVDPGELAGEFGPADKWLKANIFSEAVPSKELVGDLDDTSKRIYTAQYQRAFSNPDAQNALAQQSGLLAPDQTRFIGEYEGVTNPNIVTTIMADPAKGADIMSEWSTEAVNFNGALQGLLGGQADVATSFLRRSKRVGDINAARIPFDRAIDEADVRLYSRALKRGMRDNDIPGEVITNFRSGNELEVTWLPPDNLDAKTKRTAQKGFRDLVTETSGGRAIDARNSGGLLTYASEFKPSNYLPMLQNPKMRKSVEDMIPKIAADIERDVASLPLTDKGREIYQRTLNLMKEGGLEAVEKGVRDGVLPVAVIGALLLGANQVPQQPQQAPGPT